MKKIYFSLCLALISTVVSADWKESTGWKDIEIFANSKGGSAKDLIEVMPKTYGAYWAGRLTEFYWDKSLNAATKARVRVTWSSDRGEPCGKIVVLSIDNYKDFNFRSIAMKECG